MLIARFLSLVLVLTICWAHDPIFEDVQPIIFGEILTDLYRLPKVGVKPVNYKITLQPYFKDVPPGKAEFSFDGFVNITLNVKKQITNNTLTLHAKNLEFDTVLLQYKIEGNSRTEEIKANLIENIETEFITLNFEQEIPLLSNTTYYLIFKYNGTLKNDDDLFGFYRSYYKKGNNTEWLAATQFEPVSARRAFPCWDEPNYKATFDITIIHPSDYIAISNMPEKEKPKDKKENQDDKLKTTTFYTTPKMSTYLVAFVVSKYDYKSSNNNDKFSVWTRPDVINSTKYALECGQVILSELENYTDYKYYKLENSSSMNMLKMDQISIPQFQAGAMENWGLVTYKESALLYTENVTTKDMQDIATVISHEFAHQWFGNLVTPEWWKYIWLNEGFATFFQYFTVDSVQKNNNELSWRLMEQFVVKNQQESAFVTDASINTRKMNQDAATSAEIHALFDNIAYKKAACVIRMMQHFLREDIFQEGLKQYLKNKSENTVTPEDLFTAMQSANNNAKKPELDKDEIKEIMENWINQPGYPVIKVDRNNTSGETTITQQRFFLSGPSKTDKTFWYIPINYITEDEPEIKSTTAKLWIPPEENSINLNKIVNATKWVIFNNLQTGYYRVNYDDHNWELLAKYLRTDKYVKLQPVTRAQLIDDSLSLARAGYLSYNRALPITLYLDKETDYIPWYAAIRGFDFLDRNLQAMSNYKDFKKYVVQRLKKYVNMVELTETPKNNTFFFQLGRELALTTSCRYGLDTCKQYTQQKFKKWLEDKKKLPTDLRDGILCAGVRQADQNAWNTTLSIWQDSTDSNEKTAIFNALGCVQDKKVIQTFLELSLEDKNIDFFATLNTICTNNYGSFDILIDFIEKNIKKIQNKDPENLKLTAYVNQLASRVVTKLQYEKLMFFMYQNKLFSSEGMLTGLENLYWIDKNQDVISAWVKENYKPENNSATSISAMSLFIVISMLISRFY